jgi:hypothetical protein
MPKKNRGRITKKRPHRKMKGGMFEWLMGKPNPQDPQQMTSVVPVDESPSTPAPSSSWSLWESVKSVFGKSDSAPASDQASASAPDSAPASDQASDQASASAPAPDSTLNAEEDTIGGKRRRRRHKKTKRRGSKTHV